MKRESFEKIKKALDRSQAICSVSGCGRGGYVPLSKTTVTVAYRDAKFLRTQTIFGTVSNSRVVFSGNLFEADGGKLVTKDEAAVGARPRTIYKDLEAKNGPLSVRDDDPIWDVLDTVVEKTKNDRTVEVFGQMSPLPAIFVNQRFPRVNWDESCNCVRAAAMMGTEGFSSDILEMSDDQLRNIDNFRQLTVKAVHDQGRKSPYGKLFPLEAVRPMETSQVYVFIPEAGLYSKFDILPKELAGSLFFTEGSVEMDLYNSAFRRPWRKKGGKSY